MKYPYYLFLDDERFPGQKDKPLMKWHIARNVRDAQWHIETYGVPEFMSLDHDLGANNLTGMDFVKWFCDYLMDNYVGENTVVVPNNFRYYVHSQNPVGAENMQSYLDNYFKDN